MQNQWRMGNQVIQPEKLNMPVFCAIPKQDHVVPYECAMPLARRLKDVEVHYPSAGHVGMIVGSRAKRELWQPLCDWVSRVSS